jgi:hypothetical protein
VKINLAYCFVKVSGGILFVTAVAKLVSSTGSARILQNSDPILLLTFKNVLWMVGLIEFMIALICVFGKDVRLQAGLIACLATNFVVYRLGLTWIGYKKPCSCLGSLTDALHIPPKTADTAMKIILAYLLVGSYALLIGFWRQRRQTSQSLRPSPGSTV